MKKVIVLCTVVLVLFMPTFLFASSCGGEECPLNPDPDYYYIQFNISGPEYTIGEPVITLNLGFPPYSTVDPLAVLVNANHIRILGSNCEDENPEVAAIRLEIHLYPETAEVYEGTYTDEGTAIGTCVISGEMKEGSSEGNFYGSTDATVTITSYGDVMGDVEGSFSCTLEYAVTPTPSFGSPLTLSGNFRVKSETP